MAYKILNKLLPVDIVNGILEYNGYSNVKNKDITVLHLYKIYNVLKISCMGSYMDVMSKKKYKAFTVRINKLKKNNYAEINFRYMTYLYMDNIKKVIKTVPRNVNKDGMHKYTKNNIIKCDECVVGRIGFDIGFCKNCDFSQCKDNEIMFYAYE